MTDKLNDAFEQLRELIVLVEDEFSEICAIPAYVDVHKYKDSVGQIRRRRPVANLCFNGEHLQLKRFDRKKETDYTDVLDLGLDDSSLLCEIVRMLPIMHKRLLADASVDIGSVLKATKEARSFIATVKGP